MPAVRPGVELPRPHVGVSCVAVTSQPEPEPDASDPAPEVIKPRPRVTERVKLNAEQQKLLREYHEGVAKREAERAAAAEAPPVQYEPKSRLNRSYDDDGETQVVPINPMRQSAYDAPPPPEFDPDNAPPELDRPTRSAWARDPVRRTAPTARMQMAKVGRVAG